MSFLDKLMGDGLNPAQRKARIKRLHDLAVATLTTDEGQEFLRELTFAQAPAAPSFDFTNGPTDPLKAAYTDGHRDVIATLCLLTKRDIY